MPDQPMAPIAGINLPDDPSFSPVSLPQRASLRKRNYWSRFEPQDYSPLPEYKSLPYLQEARLIQRAQAGDLAARNEVWIRNARLVLSAVNAFHIPEHQLPDAIQEGLLGLARAIEKYDVTRLNAFSTYAWYWIDQRIRRFLDYHRYFVRFPPRYRKALASYRRGESLATLSVREQDTVRRIAQLLHPQPLHDIRSEQHPAYLPSPSEISVDRDVLFRELKRILPKRELYVIQHRFGLGDHRRKTLQRLANHLQVTRERVRQIEMRAIVRLRKRLPVSLRPHSYLRDYKEQPGSGGDIQDTVRPQPTVAQVFQNRRLTQTELNDLLLRILKPFTFRQANAVIHFYGLFGHQPLPIEEVAELLDLTPHKTRIALKKGRDKLFYALAGFANQEFATIRRMLLTESTLEETISSQRFLEQAT